MSENGLTGLAALLPEPEELTSATTPPQTRRSVLGNSSEADEEPGCPDCHDAGFVRGELVTVSQAGAGRIESRAVPCPKCSLAPVAVGVPPDLLGCTFDNFVPARNPRMEAALGRCREVSHGRAWCALLMGNPGLGKSHLAAAALDASTHPRPGRFWKWGDFLREVRRLAFSDSGPRLPEDDVLRPWQSTRTLLVLDDVGAEKQTEWAEQTLYAVIDARYSAKLPTIATTNNPGSLGDRILSRLYEGAVVCEGQDQRRVLKT